MRLQGPAEGSGVRAAKRGDALCVGWVPARAQGGSWALGAGSRVGAAQRLAAVGLLAWRRPGKCMGAAGRSWPSGGWCPATASWGGRQGRRAGAVVLPRAPGAVGRRAMGPRLLVER